MLWERLAVQWGCVQPTSLGILLLGEWGPPLCPLCLLERDGHGAAWLAGPGCGLGLTSHLPAEGLQCCPPLPADPACPGHRNTCGPQCVTSTLIPAQPDCHPQQPRLFPCSSHLTSQTVFITSMGSAW